VKVDGNKKRHESIKNFLKKKNVSESSSLNTTITFFKTIKSTIMKMKLQLVLLLFGVTIINIVGCKKNQTHFCDGDDTIVATTKVFSTGFNNPRGLKFGPDGNLYVAEGGLGGTNSTVGLCEQVSAPVGPVFGSTTSGRISRVSPSGVRTTITDQLPSSMIQASGGGFISGVADVAFVGNDLYAVLAGAGCSHGVPSVPNGVVKINNNGTWSMVANLSEYTMTHETAHPEPHGGAEPDGTPYSMINVHGVLYVIEPNHGDYIKVTTDGTASRFVDISASQNHIVPTVQEYFRSNFYVGNLDTFPAPHGGSKILKITNDGQVSDFATGFNMILGIAFDQLGGLYVLENTTNNPFPTPGTGDIVRIDPSGTRQVITSGLNLPTGITFGPDGKLYVSNWGYGAPAGGGEILQISFKCDQIRGNKDIQ
jgi:hypothetical protein